MHMPSSHGHKYIIQACCSLTGWPECLAYFQAALVQVNRVGTISATQLIEQALARGKPTPPPPAPIPIIPPQPAASMQPSAKTPQAVPPAAEMKKPALVKHLFADTARSAKPRPLAWAPKPQCSDIALVELAQAFPALPAESIAAMHRTANHAGLLKCKLASTTTGPSHR
ncbi:hypothetical protein AN958_11332 [Leucoagaricus sp. SymC.cos]|nr:hypothetical protein AN958_11332 [Leucoagaricus sp. SymC.cos]